MSLDTSNRAFIALLGLAVTATIALGFARCCVFALVAARVITQRGHTVSERGKAPGLILIALLGVGAVRGSRSLRRQVIVTDRLSRRVTRLRQPLPEALVVAAATADLEGRVDLIASDEVFSFTYGMLRPRVAVTEGVLEHLEPSEIAAVLAHEGYHVANLDPLKVFLARSLPAAFFYLPALASLRRRYVTARELAADRQASAACGPSALAGALLKVGAGPRWANLGAAAAMAGDDSLDARVTQLEIGAEPPIRGVSGAAALSTVAGGVVLVWSVWASMAAFGGPGGVMTRMCRS